jgi:hypothetical protein
MMRRQLGQLIRAGSSASGLGEGLATPHRKKKLVTNVTHGIVIGGLL